MKAQVAALLSSAACVAAFQAPSAFGGVAMKSVANRASMTMEMSPSLPFLVKPKNLEGLPGYKGFDPIGFCEYFDPKFMIEAEIKHCRAAMLAFIGIFVQQVVHLPGAAYQSTDPVKACLDVGASPLLQIALFIGFLEFTTNNGKITYQDIFSDPNRKPGEFGFDPLGFSKDGMTFEMRAKEIENGRFAMLAVFAMWHHQILLGHL